MIRRVMLVRSVTLAALSSAAAVAACGSDDSTDSPAQDGGTTDGGSGRPDSGPLADGGAPADSAPSSDGASLDGASSARRVIIFVWDGLRPDSVDMNATPNLYALKTGGVSFDDNHSTYPTFTMMNASTFASGSFPATAGFYGNTIEFPPGDGGHPTGPQANGTPEDFTESVFTEDWQVLRDLDAYYGGQLLLVDTLFQQAQAAGLKTVAVGKAGAAALQDYKGGGIILDENTAYPESFASELLAHGLPVPTNDKAFYDGGLSLLPDGSAADAAVPNPTAAPFSVLLNASLYGNTADPTDTSGNLYKARNQYFMDVYSKYILPSKLPDLSVIWFRVPDSDEHPYGPGTANYAAALADQDALLGELEAQLKALDLDTSTDLIVVSDHAHSSVSGPTDLFPLRGFTGAAGAKTVGDVDAVHGYSVSGYVRLADLLTKSGGFTAYDGNRCTFDPTLAGYSAAGEFVNPTQTDDGSECGTTTSNGGTVPSVPHYTFGDYRNPSTANAGDLIVAANGGSDYIYVVQGDTETVNAQVADVVQFLQSREELGAIFVASQYGAIPGTLPLTAINVEGTNNRRPDIVVSYTWDKDAVIAGKPGIEFQGTANVRGMHGSFSPVDVHNSLFARGPHFKTGLADSLPTGNVDVAPTAAHLLGIALDPRANGRPLLESLVASAGGVDAATYQTAPVTVASTTATVAGGFTRADGSAWTAKTANTYSINLQTTQLTYSGTRYTYFDFAQAIRK